MPEKAPSELTTEQENILQTIFLYDEAGDLTEKDVADLAAMFDKPEKFVLLRRALQVLTPAERGLTIKDSKTFIETPPNDVTKYAFDMAVDIRTDEKIRQSLVALYRRVRMNVVEGKKAEFESQNIADAEEQQRTEEFEEKQEEDQREVGPRL